MIYDVEAVVDDGVKVLSEGMVTHAGCPKGIAGHLHVQVVLLRHILQVVRRQRGQSASQGVPCEAAPYVDLILTIRLIQEPFVTCQKR